MATPVRVALRDSLGSVVFSGSAETIEDNDGGLAVALAMMAGELRDALAALEKACADRNDHCRPISANHAAMLKARRTLEIASENMGGADRCIHCDRSLVSGTPEHARGYCSDRKKCEARR